MTVEQMATILRDAARDLLPAANRPVAFAIVVAECHDGGELTVVSNLDTTSLDSCLADALESTRRNPRSVLP